MQCILRALGVPHLCIRLHHNSPSTKEGTTIYLETPQESTFTAFRSSIGFHLLPQGVSLHWDPRSDVAPRRPFGTPRFSADGPLRLAALSSPQTVLLCCGPKSLSAAGGGGGITFVGEVVRWPGSRHFPFPARIRFEICVWPEASMWTRSSCLALWGSLFARA